MVRWASAASSAPPWLLLLPGGPPGGSASGIRVRRVAPARERLKGAAPRPAPDGGRPGKGSGRARRRKASSEKARIFRRARNGASAPLGGNHVGRNRV